MAIVEGKPITVKITAKARGLQIKVAVFLLRDELKMRSTPYNNHKLKLQ